MGILDKIIDTRQHQSLQEFEPEILVAKLLGLLVEREKQILRKRYGLQGSAIETLETVGKELNLTRERVRQIEKELIKSLRKELGKNGALNSAKGLIITLVSEHGGAIPEHKLLKLLGAQKPADSRAVIFILGLISELEKVENKKQLRPTWSLLGFDHKFLEDFLFVSRGLIEAHGNPLSGEEFLEKFKSHEFHGQHQARLNDKIVLNFLDSLVIIQQNPFGHYGLSHWSQINPKDVGDKAYLAMKHHKKPEHYSVITELINQIAFDRRKAYKETVHNELIKDKRFVLVGRGIYALAEWGYKPGVVAEVIKEILQKNHGPLTREQIIEEVLKRRLVKKNTILVGLSNRQLFKKAGKNLYALA